MPVQPERLVRLTSAPNELEAGMVVATLAENGIRATATGATTAGFRAEAPGWVHVLVAEDDLQRAEAVLAEVDQTHDDIDWSQVDVGQPEDASLPDAIPWWMQRRFWRYVVIVGVVFFLARFAAGILRMLIRLIGGFKKRGVKSTNLFTPSNVAKKYSRHPE